MNTGGVIAKGQCGDNVFWTLKSNGLLELTGTGNMYSLASNTAYSYYPYLNNIKNIVVGDGITSVGKQAFFNYKAENVELPSTLLRLEDSSISLDTMPDIVIPASVNYIGNYVIRKNTPSVYFAGTAEQWAVLSKGRYFNGDTHHDLYLQNVKADKITISNSATISTYAFYLSNITSVELIGNVTTLSNLCFALCSLLEEVLLGDKVTTIKETVFSNCVKLKKIVFGKTISNIANYAFNNCNSCILYDFRTYSRTAIPTIGTINVFNAINENAKIVVPDALYDAWIASPVWSDANIVSHIIKASDYVE